MATMIVCECCFAVAENGGADGTACGIDMCGTTHPRRDKVGAIPFGLIMREEDEWVCSASECDACGAELLYGTPTYEYSDEPEPMMSRPDRYDREEFWNGYRAAMIWTAQANEPDEFGGNGDTLDSWADDDETVWAMVDADTRADVQREAYRFMRDMVAMLTEKDWETYAETGVGDPWARAGHDFCLTRNGHGVGFWDRGAGEVGDRLTALAESYGARDMSGALSGPMDDDGTTLTAVYVD